MVIFSKDVCIAILQNSGIRSFFYTIVRHDRMPPMDTETIGGISTGLSSHSGLVCVPPYSQNAGVASTYVTVWRLLACHVSQLQYSYLLKLFSQSAGERDFARLERMEQTVDDDGIFPTGERIHRRKPQI